MSYIHIEKCPLCGSANVKPEFVCKDYYASNEEFNIYRCVQCNFLFTNNFPDKNSIGQYYNSSEYISHSNDKSGFVNKLYYSIRKYAINNKLKYVCKKADRKTGKICDIGCGIGYFLNAARNKGWQTVGIEKNESARNTAQETFGLCIKDTDEINSLPNASFDVVTLWHVLEHIENLSEMMEKIHSLLLPDGIAVIAVPNCISYDARHYREFWAAYDVPRHLWHFTPQTLEVLANKFNFRITDKKPMLFDSFYVSLLSEKYRRSNTAIALIKAFATGLASNINTWFKGKDKASSVIYVLRKK